MFNNIGAKIKALAKVLTLLGVLTSFLFALRFIESSILIALVIIIVGAAISWLGNFLLYGFGELVENSTIIAKHLTGRKEKETETEDSEYDEEYYNEEANCFPPRSPQS